ncbi:hypothetical protein KM043_012046 [Ampulex compressa]|nr:hypothetical protein KM043_012046 [Ampulex compressa]
MRRQTHTGSDLDLPAPILGIIGSTDDFEPRQKSHLGGEGGGIKKKGKKKENRENAGRDTAEILSGPLLALCFAKPGDADIAKQCWSPEQRWRRDRRVGQRRKRRARGKKKKQDRDEGNRLRWLRTAGGKEGCYRRGRFLSDLRSRTSWS